MVSPDITGDFVMPSSHYLEGVFQNWWDLLGDIRSSLERNELLKWLNDYLLSFQGKIIRSSLKSSSVLLDKLLSIFQECGLSHQLYFAALFLLSVAMRDFLTTDRKNADLQKLQDVMLADLAFHIGDSYTATKDLLEKELNNTATLLRVTKAASSSLELGKVLSTISEEIVQSLDARACNSFLFPDPEKIGVYYILDEFSMGEYKVPEPPELFGLDALQRGEPVMCYDAALDPRTDKRTVEFFDLKSLLAFPLISKGKVVAAGLVVMKDYHHFTRAEIDLVMGIANSGALAVENAKFHDTQLQLAIAQERDLLAQELHDRIAQTLAIVKLNLNYLLIHQPKNELATKIEETKKLADEAYQDVRDAILGLRFLKSKEYKISDFKEYLAIYGAHHNVDIIFELHEEFFRDYPGEALLQVGKIIDEAVVNSCKHAHAQHVWIRGEHADKKLWVSIEDDGIGINWDEHKHIQDEHFGIQIMQERARKIGGVLTISNRESGGTCVRMEIIHGKESTHRD